MQDSNQVSQILSDLSKTGEKVTVKQIIDSLEGRGIALLMAVFSVPAAMPIPAPVLATILGVPLVMLTLQLFLGRETLWIPEKIASKEMSSGVLGSASKWLRRIEFFLRPRFSFIISRHIISIICLIFAVVMMFPIPLTNTVPAFSILIISLGLFQRDGLFVLAGTLLGIVWIGLLSYATYIAGDEFVEFVREML